MPAFAAEPGTDFFEQKIRPVLVARCYECHSQASAKVKGGLRLDTRDDLRKGGESGAAIQPGQPNESILIKAVRYTSDDLRMPPKGKLPQHEIAALVEWVKMGAPDPRTRTENKISVNRGAGKNHWAFEPLSKRPIPAVRNAMWADTAVDRFILSALEEKGLQPNGLADRQTLIRRASFDLIGLPPRPAEVEAFAQDTAPDAFARVVDRLLASSQYGERWGRHWLDVVRYADTAGETADYPVPEAYRYRNYVIDAFNRDRPYDVFIREQIAGDIMAQHAARGQITHERYAELVTATGFLAVARRFGYDTERYEHLTMADTIDVLGQSMQGLTLGCARCHDHKYDPVTMEDYYGLYGIFASTRLAFAGSERMQSVRAMAPLLPPAEARRREQEFNRRQTELESLVALYQELQRKAGGKTPAFTPPALPQVTLRWINGLDGDFESQAPPNGGSLGLPFNPWVASGGSMIETVAQSPLTNVYRKGSSGAVFPSGPAEHSLGRGLPVIVPDTNGNLHFNLDFRLVGPASAGAGSYRVYLGRGPGKDAALTLFIGPDAFFVSHGSVSERICPLQPGVWNNVQLALDLKAKTFSGAVGTPSALVTFAGKPFHPRWEGVIDYFLIDTAGHLPGPKPGLHADNFALSAEPLPSLSSPPTKKNALAQAELKKRIENLYARLVFEIEHEPFPQAYGAWEGTPQDVHIQKRGEPEHPGTLASRRFIEVLGGQRLAPDAGGSGRLELANWLTSPENPLTARVMVNRIWQHHFGRGLVATPNDFGSRGRRPTHPDLLDYLAGRFMAQGWSVKAMHRLIMLSRTYQLSSLDNPQAAASDPGNHFLARFPRQRLDAECIRDALLALGGNLEFGPAGPHPFPPLSQQRFTQHAPYRAIYETNRRSIYLMTQRTSRHPFLALFDGPDTNASTGDRAVTTVPTQALFLMNDPFVHRQAAGFAYTLLHEPTDDSGNIERAITMALARRPRPAEMSESLKFLRRYREALTSAGLPPGERDAQTWAAFVRTIFARNEFVFVD